MKIRLSKLIRLLCLLILICMFAQLIFILTQTEFSQSFFNTGVRYDFEDLDFVAKKHTLKLYILGPESLTGEDRDKLYFKNGDIVYLGIDFESVTTTQLQAFGRSLSKLGFALMEFFNKDYFELHKNVYITVSMVLKRNVLICIYILYTKEDNSWWFGALSKDEQWHYKFAVLDVNPSLYSSILSKEKLIKKFAAVEIEKPFNSFLRPKHYSRYLEDFKHSQFVPCNSSRALLFQRKFEHAAELTTSAIRFKHRAWKLLTVVRTVFDNLSIPFWLSSGTCLGYYRQCSIIPYTKDVDIGVFASNYSDRIISALEKQDIKLMLWLGELEDSLELSFRDKYGIKLDIFFFYDNGRNMWNGGTQVRTGKKFKYLFPRFELCWTLFLTIKVRVPCDTESYIRANYGPNWFFPQVTWDWKSSPYNVKENGYWPKEKLPFVIKTYN
ncbi:fukutin-like isoform X1 [Cimex lectularius]|uniref:Fukutin n=1 Tax=Cimex lectularius TaxID=79782 RepID=A0A8I6R9K7_CIMLE|nr:fukutin-like isoform X1 [Cimex lectularius]